MARLEHSGPASRRVAPLLAVWALFALTGPLAADWIVTRDGAIIETRGEWAVQGRIIVFTMKNGALSSLPVTDVDLDGSAAYTVEQRRPKALEVEPKAPEAVAVLTDDDVGHVNLSSILSESGDVIQDDLGAALGETAEDEGGGEQPATESASSEPPNVIVRSWADRGREDGGTEVTGTLVNQSENPVNHVELTVDLLDKDGELVSSVAASVGTPFLRAGQETTFTAAFPMVVTFTDFRFKVEGTVIQLGPAREQQSSDLDRGWGDGG